MPDGYKSLLELGFEREGLVISGSYFLYITTSYSKVVEYRVNVLDMCKREVYSTDITSKIKGHSFAHITSDEWEEILIGLNIPKTIFEYVKLFEQIKN